MKLTILENYDKIIEKKPMLVISTNSSLLAISCVTLIFTNNILFLAILSSANMFYILKKIFFKKEDSTNLKKEDIKFLNSLAFIYNTNQEKIRNNLNKSILLPENINKVYKKHARKLHPDLGGDTKKFQELVQHKIIIDNYLKNFKSKTIK